MRFKVVIGERPRHDVEVTFRPVLGLLRIEVDGRLVYREWRLLPSQRRRGCEFRTPGEDLHFLVLEPLAVSRKPAFRLWVDGQPVTLEAAA